VATDGMASWIDLTDPKYAAADLRRLDSLLMMPGGAATDPFSVKAGRRVNGAGLQVSVGGSPETWTCSPGPAEVYDPTYSTQGAWRVEIPNAKSGPIGARPSSGQSRIDLIVARIYDNGAIGSGPSEVKVERLAGNPGQDPQPPTPPVGSITFEVARMTVPATGAITVTQSTERTVAAGGILPVPTTAAMNKLKTDGIAYRDMVVGNAQTNSLHRYDGTNWVPVGATVKVVGKIWGADYNPASHRLHRVAGSVVLGTLAGNGDAPILADASTDFSGVASAVASSAMGSPFLVGTGVFENQIYAQCRTPGGASMGGAVGQRINFVIEGWV
jgi:hypothetical protein